MDWFSWLSKTNLDPFIVYEYSLAFSHNKLENDDISYLNHEILQSMGISIAKHRLEILKLATKQKSTHHMSKISIAITRRFSNYLNKLIHRDQKRNTGPALVCYSERLTDKRLMVDASKNISGETFLFPSARISSFSNPVVQERMSGDYWAHGDEEIKWDTMFQNLKPT